jgi:capsular exopolysaccharide synthesis family protein
MISLTLPQELVDQYGKVRQCIANDNPRKIKTLAVASATHGEGTTTVAAQLAISLVSDSQLTVLLVDANLRKPDLHQRFQVQQDTGLSELLLGERDLDAILKATAMKNLFLVTSGKSVSDPSGFFMAMDLRKKVILPAVKFDHIVIDSPPINPYPEAAVLASHSDAAVLVIQAGQTRREIVLEAQQQMSRAGVNLIGVVLNKRKYYIPEFLYRKL